VNPTAALWKQLRTFDPVDLAAGVGALQLLLQNADHLLRLERLAIVVAALPARPGETLSRMRLQGWRDLLNMPPVAGDAIVAAEDSFSQPFTDSIMCPSGAFTVLAGSVAGEVDVIRGLLDALFARDTDVSSEFVTASAAIATAVLALSDRIARKAGLHRYALPMPGKGQPCLIPNAEVFRRLKAAVRETWAQLQQEFEEGQIEALRMLMRRAGDAATGTSVDDAVNALYRWPLIDFGAELVVLFPSGLLASLRHQIIVGAEAWHSRETLAWRYREVVARDVAHSLHIMGWTRLALQTAAPPDGFVESFYQFDDTSFAHVLVYVDPLDRYDPLRPRGVRDDHALAPLIEQRLSAARDLVEQALPSRQLLHLVVIGSAGRRFGLLLHSPSEDDSRWLLTITSQDLGVIARREAGDPLALWKFARASEIVRRRSQVLAVNRLDEYAIYLQYRRSYYRNDDTVPRRILIDPMAGYGLRTSDLLGRDRHGVVDTTSSTLCEVSRQHVGTDIPIYVAGFPDRTVDFLVEGLPVAVWVMPLKKGRSHLRWQLCQAVAYWVWQASTVLSQPLHEVAKARDQVVLYVAAASDEWSGLQREQGTAHDWLKCTVLSADTIVLDFIGGTVEALGTAVNTGERQLARTIIEALVVQLAGVADVNVDVALEAFAPLGRKRALSVVTTATNDELHPGPLPKCRLVDSADRALRRDELGMWLQSQGPAGPIASSKRVAVLNGAVALFFERLVELVSALSPDGLLEFLVRQNESLTYDEAHRRLTLPARIACFGMNDRLAKDLEERIPTVAETAVANRFLIEYIAAQPPAGSRHIDLTTYDELLSVSLEIVELGNLSDAITLDLADPQLSLLKSGRLGISRADSYHEALRAFLPGRVRSDVSEAEEFFERHWREVGERDESSWLASLDAAFLMEFGVGMWDFCCIYRIIRDLGDEQAGEPKTTTLVDVTRTIAKRMQWSVGQAERVLERFTISPRTDFIPPDDKHAAYPWQFGRDLSYLRRPLLERRRLGEQQLLWGNRHLFRAGLYLMQSCASGRFNPKSLEMKRFISESRTIRSEKFNDDVAELLEKPAGLQVRRRVWKIGGRKLRRDNNQDLGDIDVLVVDAHSREIIAIEVKDMASARTPHELTHELKSLFVGERSHVAHHLERIAWLKQHWKDVLTEFGIDSRGPRWHVTGLIVMSQELISPLLTASPLRIVAFPDLERDPSLIRG
jgi:hypothetical protein